VHFIAEYISEALQVCCAPCDLDALEVVVLEQVSVVTFVKFVEGQMH